MINRKDGYHVCDLFKGDTISNNVEHQFSDPKSHNLSKATIPQNIDNCYFGDTYAKTDVQILFIKYSDFDLIPLSEIERIFINSNDNIDVDMRRKSIIYRVSTRKLIYIS